MSSKRPKLSIIRHTKLLDDIVPLPQAQQGLDRTRRGSDERRMVDDLRRENHEAGRGRGAEEHRIAACDTGDGKEVAIAAFLNPVCDHFDMDADETAALAAFTRMLTVGGRPKRGSQASDMRPIDMR